MDLFLKYFVLLYDLAGACRCLSSSISFKSLVLFMQDGIWMLK